MKRSSYFIILILFAFFESDAQKGQYLMLPEFRFIINPDSFFVHEISNDFNSIPSGLNVYFYNQTYELEIKIETGYLPSQANWKYSINNTDFPVSPLEKEHYSRQRLYANTTHEVKKINGHTFNWNLTFTEECSSAGKADLCEIDVLYDSIFDNFSFVRIWVSASTVYSGNLSKYIAKIESILKDEIKFERIDPSVILQSALKPDIAHSQLLFEKSLRKNTRKCKLKSYLLTFRDTSQYQDDYLVRCARNKINLQFVQECKTKRRRWQLADTITTIRKEQRIREWNALMNLFEKSNYVPDHEYQVFKRFSEFETPYTDYLNAIYPGKSQGNIDTLFYFMLLSQQDLREYYQDWSPPRHKRNRSYFSDAEYTPIIDLTNPENQYSLRGFFKQTEEFLTRTIYHNEFGLTSPYHLNYLAFEPTDSTRAYVLYANGLDTSSTQYLVTLSERTKFDWKIEIDTLNNQILLDGTEKLIRFNDYFFMETNSSSYVLNTTTSPATWIQLNTQPKELTRFDFISRDTQFNQDGRYVTPSQSHFSADMKKLNLHYPEATLENYHPTERDPIYQREIRGKINREEKKLQDFDLLRTHIARENIPTDNIAFRVDYTLEDLNSDGIDELFSYAISNGQCVYIDCYTSENGTLKQLTIEEAQLWLSSNQNFKNLIIYSQIGMHGNSN